MNGAYRLEQGESIFTPLFAFFLGNWRRPGGERRATQFSSRRLAEVFESQRARFISFGDLPADPKLAGSSGKGRAKSPATLKSIFYDLLPTMRTLEIMQAVIIACWQSADKR